MNIGAFANHLAGREVMRKSGQFWLVAIMASIMMGAAVSQATAHEVSPMRVELAPHSGSKSGLLMIRNTRQRDLAFEIVALRRTTAPDGTETLQPADTDFVLFPPQGLVAPGASQAVRFEYTGDAALTEGRAYLLDVREVPVTPPGFSGILTVYNFGVAVYISPPGAFTDLEVTNINRADETITFDVINRGNNFAVLSRRSLELRFGADRVRLSGTDFSRRINNPVVPPNSTRHFQMLADGLPQGVPSEIHVLRQD